VFCLVVMESHGSLFVYLLMVGHRSLIICFSLFLFRCFNVQFFLVNCLLGMFVKFSFGVILCASTNTKKSNA
jgi:hypothetical protein